MLHVIYLSFSIEFLISKEISSCNLFLGNRDVPQDFRLFEQMHLRRQTGASVSQEIRHRCNGLPAKPKAILLQFAVESRAEVDIKNASLLMWEAFLCCIWGIVCREDYF